jgi:hypothetical protein
MLHVACRLRPRDIFALSFTSKLNYQMIDSAPLIWKRARLTFMPARILHPPYGMTERQYAWLLTSDRCMKCHLVKPLEIYWMYNVNCCVECLESIRSDSTSTIESSTQVLDARNQESAEEANLIRCDFLVRVRALGDVRCCGSGRRDRAILVKIPCYANIVNLKSIPVNPTDTLFVDLVNDISKGTLYYIFSLNSLWKV